MIKECLICNKESPEVGHFYKVHRIKIEDYCHQHSPRFNKLTKKLLKFKSVEQYFNQDFEDRQELKAWMDVSDKEEIKKYLVEFLTKRKVQKNLIYLPSQFESRTLIFPSISFLVKFFKDFDILEFLSNEVGLINRFNYNQQLDYNTKELKFLIDTRESLPLDLPNKTISKLEQGDYSVIGQENITIDRKSLIDGLGTLSGGFERFEREIQRSKEINQTIILMWECEFQELNNFNEKRHLKYVKASPEFILHRARELCQRYDNFQIACIKSRNNGIEFLKKIFTLKNSIQTVDLQYFIERGLLL